MLEHLTRDIQREILGIDQPSVSRMLRYELSKAEKQRIKEAVEKEVKS